MKQHKVFSFRSQQEFTVIETDHISSPFKKKKQTVRMSRIKKRFQKLPQEKAAHLQRNQSPRPSECSQVIPDSKFQPGTLQPHHSSSLRTHCRVSRHAEASEMHLFLSFMSSCLKNVLQQQKKSPGISVAPGCVPKSVRGEEFRESWC